jgi:transposase
MANKVITMQQVRSIIQLLTKGYSLRVISQQLRLSRKTITAYANRFHNSGYSLEELRSLDDASLSAKSILQLLLRLQRTKILARRILTTASTISYRNSKEPALPAFFYGKNTAERTYRVTVIPSFASC